MNSFFLTTISTVGGGFIFVFSHGAIMKKCNNSLTNNEILAFWHLFVYCTNILSKGL